MSAAVDTESAGVAFRLVDESTFAIAMEAARKIRILRHVLWHYGQTFDNPSDEDAPWRWFRVAAAATHAELYRRMEKVERWGDCSAWLITQEHHDAASNLYAIDGTPLEPTWQPSTPALLRTKNNPSHWIPVQCLIPWNFCSAIALTDSPKPDDWNQVHRALIAPESDVFVHFTTADGPYNSDYSYRRSSADIRILAQHKISERMSAFLGGRTTASPTEMITAVVQYIQRNRLVSGHTQIVTPDATLTSLFEGRTATFQMWEIHRLIRPHYGIMLPTEDD
jgi:hypothetical protein